MGLSGNFTLPTSVLKEALLFGLRLTRFSVKDGLCLAAAWMRFL